jgi:hypothetical protein
MAPRYGGKPHPQTDFHVFGHRFRIETAFAADGVSVEMAEPEVSLIINETKGTATENYAWFPNTTPHAIDWALLHSTNTTVATFGRWVAPPLPISLRKPMLVDRFAPRDNRTDMGVVQQKSEDLFLVKFTINSKDFKDPIEFFAQFQGKAPNSFIGRIVQGILAASGSGPKQRGWD